MEWEPCTHLTARSHIVGTRKQGRKQRPIWRCSKCGADDVWGPGWRYYGSVECKRCTLAAIDRVECPKCAAKGTA